MVNNFKAQKLLKEYQDQISNFEAFSLLIRQIIESLLKKHGFKYQLIQSGAKSVSSTEKKINSPTAKYSKLGDIIDLSRCRVVFYLDKEAERFSQTIYQEFGARAEELGYEYRRKYSEKGYYSAVHHVVKLDSQRTKLPEYAPFKEMRCEVQLTTVLCHALNEIGHDTIYKLDDELRSFNQYAYEVVCKKFSEVSKRHIEEAQNDIDYLHERIVQLIAGREFFNSPDLLKLSKGGNNKIYDNLDLLTKHIEQCGDYTPPTFDTFKLVDSAVTAAKSNPIVPIDSVIGKLKGKTENDILTSALEVIDLIRLKSSRKSLHFLLKHYLGASEKNREKFLTLAARLAKYDLNILKRVGYMVQQDILRQLKIIPVKRSLTHLQLINRLASELLKKDFEGMETNAENIQIQTGALQVNPKLKSIYKQTIDLLIKLFDKSEKFHEKVLILKTMSGATCVPAHCAISPEMEAVLRTNGNRLLSFFFSLLQSELPLLILVEISEQVEWMQRRISSLSSIKVRDIRVLLNRNETYTLYNSLVWRANDPEEREGRIDQLVQEYSEKILKGKKNQVLKSIQKISETSLFENNFRYHEFRQFINKLAKNSPSFCIELIQIKGKSFDAFRAELIRGCLASNEKARTISILREWSRVNRNRWDLLNSIRFLPKQIFFINQLIRKNSKDGHFLRSMGQYLLTQNNSSRNNRVALEKVIQLLDSLKSNFEISFIDQKAKQTLERLSSKSVDTILNGWLRKQRLTDDDDRALSVFANRNVRKIIHFFHKRVAYRQKLNRDEFEYQAIPHEFHDLKKVIRAKGEEILPELLKWLDRDAFRWHASKLIRNIFPLDHFLEKFLLDHSNTRNKLDNIVFPTLHAYGAGCWAFKRVFEKIIGDFGQDADCKSEMFRLLTETGVVVGEDGLVRAYKSIRDRLKSTGWLSSDQLAIRNFGNDFDSYLDARIKEEEKRSSVQVAQWKRRFQ